MIHSAALPQEGIDMGGFSGPKIQQDTTPLAEKVHYQESAFTSFDEGQTWQDDENTHFMYEGQDWYTRPGEDINDRSLWRADTMSDWHRSSEWVDNWESEKLEAQRVSEHNEEVRRIMQRQAALQEAAIKKAQEAADAAEAKLAAAEAAAEAKEKKRLMLMAQGYGTNKTGGQGDTSKAPVRRPFLGAVRIAA
jgi:hypothetical protein